MPESNRVSPVPVSVWMAYEPAGTRTVTSPVPLLMSIARGAVTKSSSMSPVPLSTDTVGDWSASPRTSPCPRSIESAVSAGIFTV